MIDCTYKQGRYDEEGVARHGYAVDAPFIDTPRQARAHYSKRFGIEATYRLSEASLISTTTQDATRRLLFVVIRAAWNALSVRREVPANKPPDDRFTR